MRVQCDVQGAQCLVTISGRITIDSSPELRILLLQYLLARSCQDLTVDFSGVEYIDTSGLAVLIEILRAARAAGKSFRLSQLRGKPLFLLEATHLVHLFDGQTSEASQTGGPSAEHA